MYVFLCIRPVVVARNDAQDNFTLTVIIDMNVLTTLNNDKVYELYLPFIVSLYCSRETFLNSYVQFMPTVDSSKDHLTAMTMIT